MGYTQQQFLEKIKPYVIADMQKSNILASLSAAQALLESGTGNSGLTQKANNLFGIKGTYNGQSVKMLTSERINGEYVKVYADFRKYPSWGESITDHSAFLLKYKRYASIIGERNYITACQKMANSGYATAEPSKYFNSLVSIIQKNKLYEWDGLTTSEVPQITSTPFTIGKVYKLIVNLHVRSTAGGEKLKFNALTSNGKENAYFDDYGYAILRAGTKVTCKEVVEKDGNTWMRIPSGYVCAIEKGKVYIE